MTDDPHFDRIESRVLEMTELIAGIVAGFLVSHWSYLIALPCAIGTIKALSTALGLSFEERVLAEKAKTDPEAHAELEFFRSRRPTMSVLAFFFSSMISFVPCLIVGGIRLTLFEM